MANKKVKNRNKLIFRSIPMRKKVILITLLALVAIGTGIVIKSFAATASTNFGIAEGTLVPSSDKDLQGYTAEFYTDPGKNATRVIKMHDYHTVQAGTSLFYIPQGRKFNLCVTTRGNLMSSARFSSSDTYQSTELAMFNAGALDPNTTDSTYTYRCSQTYTSSGLHGPIYLCNSGKCGIYHCGNQPCFGVPYTQYKYTYLAGFTINYFDDPQPTSSPTK